MTTNLRQAVFSTLVCNSLIWYDYALYGTLIGIISHLFFPSDNEFISMIEAFAVFAIGFIMRPVGAALFGHVGDKHSRKYALLIAIASMTIPMLFIALLPTYDSIGIMAPILLIVVRLLQGLALGGEAGNAAFLIEYAPKKHRGFICSFEVFSAIVGSILSAIAIAVCKLSMDITTFDAWGWRLPFVFGIIIGIIGLFLRNRTDESPTYQKSHSAQTVDYPLKNLFKDHKKNFFVAIGIDSVEEATLYVFLIFFHQVIAIQNQYTDATHALALITLAIFTLIFATLSDRYGRKTVLLTTFIVLAFTSYPIFWLATQENIILIAIAQVLLAIIAAASLGPVSAAALESFPITVRYTGFALSRNIAAAIFGGMAPLICSSLQEITGYKTSPFLFLLFTALIGIISFMFFKDRYKEDIS